MLLTQLLYRTDIVAVLYVGVAVSPEMSIGDRALATISKLYRPVEVV